MRRSINSIQSQVCFPELPKKGEKEWLPWLARQATEHHLRWLLAHTYDGVIWAKIDNTVLLINEVAPLRWNTLIQCRFFSEVGELFLFRGPQGWKARLRTDGIGETVEYLDEQHLLWGTKAERLKNGFMRLLEGSQGITHTLPIQTKPDQRLRARLSVRHYLHEDEKSGIVRIAHSRLVSLIEPKGTSS